MTSAPVSAPGRRLLFVHGTAGRYGADRSLLLLATAMDRRGWKVTVALGADGPLAADLRAAGVGVVMVDVGMPRRVFQRWEWVTFWALTMPRSIYQTARLARRADVVHLNTSALFGALIGVRLAGRPVVMHLRESWSHQARAWSVYGHLVGRLTSAAIANSHAVAEELAALGYRAKITVVHNGIAFRPRQHPPEAASFVPDPASVVMVGRINDGKGQEILVRALAQLKARGTQVVATIAGDVFPGRERFAEDLRTLIAELDVVDEVRLVGFVEDVDGLLARHEIFTLPSVRPEGFGLVLLEAMAQGLACIASDAGGPREIIVTEKTGLLVPPGDVEALAGAIARLKNDSAERTRLGDAANTDVRARFSIERTIDGVEAVYLGILGG